MTDRAIRVTGLRGGQASGATNAPPTRRRSRARRPELGTFHRNRFDHTRGYQGSNPNDTVTLHFGAGSWAGHVDAGVGTADQNVYEDNGQPINVRGD